ncbi:MAG: hypothetical protein NTX73_10225 [Rhodobacterales bacterium]|nr:hypothetical protein [Rhodobacterales bacterium]
MGDGTELQETTPPDLCGGSLVLPRRAALHDWRGLGDVQVNFGPLLWLTGYRLWWNWLRSRPQRMVA